MRRECQNVRRLADSYQSYVRSIDTA